MKRSTLIIIAITICLSMCLTFTSCGGHSSEREASDNPTKDDKAKFVLLHGEETHYRDGKVWSQRIIDTLDYDETTGTVLREKEKSWDDAGDLEYYCEQLYNRYEEPTEQYSLDEDGNRESLSTNHVYEYDDHGNKLSETYTEDDGCATYTEYTYDAHNRLIKEHKTGNFYGRIDWLTEYKYDRKDRLIEEIQYDDGEIDGTTSHKYDENGNEVEELWWDGDSDDHYKTVFQYDEHNNLVKRTEYDLSDNSVEHVWKYEYDDNGNMVHHISYANFDGASGKLELYSEGSYEYKRL